MAGLCSVPGSSLRPSAGQLLWEDLLLMVHREVEDQLQLLPYLQEHRAVKTPFQSVQRYKCSSVHHRSHCLLPQLERCL